MRCKQYAEPTYTYESFATVITIAVWGNLTTICVTYNIPKLTPKNLWGLVQMSFFLFFLLPPVRCWLYMCDLPNSKHGCVGSWGYLGPCYLPWSPGRRLGLSHWFCWDVMGGFFVFPTVVAMMILKWVLQVVILFCGGCILATFQGLIDTRPAWKGSAIGRHGTRELWFCRLWNGLRSKQPGGVSWILWLRASNLSRAVSHNEVLL